MSVSVSTPVSLSQHTKVLSLVPIDSSQDLHMLVSKKLRLFLVCRLPHCVAINSAELPGWWRGSFM